MSNKKLGSLLLLVAMFGGIATTVTKGAVEVVPPILFASLRFFIAFFMVMLIFGKKIKENIKKEDIKPVFLLALLMSSGFIFYNLSIMHTTATNACFFYSLSTLIIPFLAKWINGVNFRVGLILGLSVTMIGMYFLVTDGGSFALNKGDWLSVISALFFALQVVFTGRYAPRVDSTVISGLQFLFVGIITLVVSVLSGESLSFASYGTIEWSAIAFAGILGTGALFVTQTMAQVKLKETTVGIIYAFIPLFTAISAWILLGERLSLIGILGGSLMIVGIIMAGRLNVPKI